MIVSGFVEVINESEVERIVESLRELRLEVHGIKDGKIVYLIEREDPKEIERTLETLKTIEGVKNVYLCYFTIEDEPKDDQVFLNM